MMKRMFGLVDAAAANPAVKTRAVRRPANSRGVFIRDARRLRRKPTPQQPSFRNREIKSRATIAFAVGPDPSAMPFDDALHNRKPHPSTFELIGRVQPLEYPEEILRVRRIKANAVVAHKENLFIAPLLGPHLDACALALPRKFKRVREQVDENLPQKRGVGRAVG